MKFLLLAGTQKVWRRWPVVKKNEVAINEPMCIFRILFFK